MRILAAAMGLLLAVPAWAEGPLPDKRLVYTRDIDFFGSDLQALFDTNLDACEQVCLADDRCTAFTFNSRSNSCFPKTSVSDRQAYEGAVSATVLTTTSDAMARAETRAGDLFFLSSRDLSAARSQSAGLGRAHQGGQWTPEVLLKAVRDRRAEGNLSSAVYWQGAAVSQTDASDMWLDYARLLGEQTDQNSSNQRRLRERALSAAVNGYLRADNDPQRVTALDVMADALIAVGRGRDAIPALRLATDIQPRDDLSARLDDAIGKFGFRIIEHVVEADLAEPRVCAEFNEPLAKSGVDYAPFVGLPEEGLAVSASGNRICVSGMTHGSRHRITFREGLPAASGEKLVKNVEITAYVRDRSPLVRFPGRAYVLPRATDAALPVETVNATELDLSLARVSDRNLLRAIQNGYFNQQLDYWQRQGFDGDISEQVWQGKAEDRQELNREITTRLPLGEALTGQPPGIYVLTAAVPGRDPYDDPGATQWFVLSDLGLTTMKGTDGLHVFVRGLAGAEARAGVEVALVSRANRVLGTAVTDDRGYAVFAPGLVRGTGGAAPALVTALDNAAEDMAFLSLTDPAFDLSDRGVEGREPAPAIDVFLATDRGAYRAGEVIHATALVRDERADALSGLPLTAILTRPDGVEYSRVLSTEDRAGGHVFALPVGSTAPRGGWRLEMRADPDGPALASATLLVEDFLPERIDFDLSLPDGPIAAIDTPTLTVEARYLFGAPAANMPMEGLVRLRPQDTLAEYPGYRFGRHDAERSPRSSYFVEGARTDDQGRAELGVTFPAMGDDTRPMLAEIELRVSEGSGRPVERRISRAIAPAAPVIGIKPLFQDDVREGGEAEFHLIGVGEDLAPAQIPVTWRVNRVTTRYQWYRLYGEWSWERSTSRTTVASGQATLGAEPLLVSADVDWGRYEIVVERDGEPYTASSVDFYAGWYVPADTITTPDVLDMSLDSQSYRPGDTATLRIVPRFAGKALVSVVSNRLIDMQAVEVAEGENLVSLPVTDEWGSGAYVTVQVVRPMDVPAGQNPARALGLAHAAIDPGDARLQVAIDTPAQGDPRAPLNATVRVAGAGVGEAAYVTVAAVDLGILNLTGFDTPDPAGHYFGQRRLGMEIRDIYGRLIDGLNGEMGQVRSGGDAARQMGFESPPPQQDLVAFFSGPVTLDDSGEAQVSFDIPQFNGTVRLMAVAWTAEGVGSAERDVIVRDPVVVTASMPRFLAPGDESRLLLEIVHAEGPTGRMGLDVTAPGLTLGFRPSGVDIDAVGGKAELSLPITAGQVGDTTIRVALTTPDGRQLVQELALGIRANDPETTATRRFTLDPGKTFSLDDEVLATYRPGTGSAILSAGPLARLDVPGLLSALDRYPYGCTEQITSRAMPLLYFDEVARALGLGIEGRSRLRIEQSIARVLTRQGANGAFGLWSVGSGDLWLDAYVTDFLSRARAAGHEVPDRAMRTALDNLRNRVNYAADFDNGGTDIAYALMVLAREGSAAMGDLRYYADEKAEAFSTPLAVAQIGAALAFYGDQSRADRMFARAAGMLVQTTRADMPVWRADYGTSLRDAAGVLSLAVEAGSNAVNRDALVQRISARPGTLSTQEMSWSLLAARAMVAEPGLSGLLFNGQAVQGPLIRRFEDGLTDTVAVTNGSARPVDITLTTFGQAEGATGKTGYGYAIERRYYTMEGAPITGPVPQGTRMVVVLEVTPAAFGEARLIVADPLPAGLEIDNPNLLRSGDVRALDWVKPKGAEHAEFRSDRFIAAVDHRSKDPFRLAYVVRAISPGSFHHPAASVEDMYRPQFRANTDSGRFDVTGG